MNESPQTPAPVPSATSAIGPERARLLAEAVSACRAALEAKPRKDFPQDWATIQNNLATALREQALASKDDAQCAHLLAESVAAHRSALEVYTREDFPQQWAMTQDNLAYTLLDQAWTGQPLRRAPLFAQAVTARRSTLEIYTRKDFPQQWATIQCKLAATLSDQAWESQNPERIQLLKAAIGCYEAALEIRTKEDLPSEHEQTQHNLSIARLQLAEAEAEDGKPR